MSGRARKAEAGFTMMELIVVLFIVALLAALAAPSVSGGITRAKETALQQDLAVMRRAIDDYYADRSAYPESLDVLVADKYIQFIPDDPIAGEEAGWLVIEDPDTDGVIDVKSTSSKEGLNGVPYEEW